jgi:hypothetical protein
VRVPQSPQLSVGSPSQALPTNTGGPPDIVDGFILTPVAGNGSVIEDQVPHGGEALVFALHAVLYDTSNAVRLVRSRQTLGGSVTCAPFSVQPSALASSATQHAPAPQTPSLPSGSLSPTFSCPVCAVCGTVNEHAASRLALVASPKQASTSKHLALPPAAAPRAAACAAAESKSERSVSAAIVEAHRPCLQV